jgi:hypothetical protein
LSRPLRLSGMLRLSGKPRLRLGADRDSSSRNYE